MTPTIMESPGKVAVLGTPGGSRSITMVLLGVLGYADGLDAAQVAALPRYHHQWQPDVLGTERDALPAEVVARLRVMGHDVLVPGEANAGRAVIRTMLGGALGMIVTYGVGTLFNVPA